MRAVFIMMFTVSLGGMLLLQLTVFAADPLPTCFGVTYDSNHPDHILGTNGDDPIVGTSGNDVIFGMNGNDVVLGQEGDDIICGGNGNDILRGRGRRPDGRR
jgi:Ca2+-binding RTX toxin-like protein